jgi:hypothetical protein
LKKFPTAEFLTKAAESPCWTCKNLFGYKLKEKLAEVFLMTFAYSSSSYLFPGTQVQKSEGFTLPFPN